MFERYTDRARRVIVLAQEHARMMGHDFIGTEHLLLGLIHEDDGVAHRALAELGITAEAAGAAVLAAHPCDNIAPSGHIPFTAQTKKALDLGFREALQLGHNYIATEHLLLGLIREGDGTGAAVLGSIVPLLDVRAKVLELLRGYATEDKPRVVITQARTVPDLLGELLERVQRIEALLNAEQERRAS